MSSNFIFAHDKPREQQKQFSQTVFDCVTKGEHLLIHAPTGLGKTAASLSPAVSYAVAENKVILFLTSRYTQHTIVLETLQKLSEKGLAITVSDFIAKKNMCAVKGIESLHNTEFLTYCKKAREQKACQFYSNTRKYSGELSVDGQLAVSQHTGRILPVKVLKEDCVEKQVCPYEISLELAKKARVIIADYNFVFHPRIRESFLRKIGVGLKDCIVIVDEAHNLADRAKDMSSSQLSTFILQNAYKEAASFGNIEVSQVLQWLESELRQFEEMKAPEQLITQEWFIDLVQEKKEYDEFIVLLDKAREKVYEHQERSYVNSVFEFCVSWKQEGSPFTRIMKRDGRNIHIMLRCLDPRVNTAEVVDEAHSIICMSGTLQPLDFYSQILGLEDATRLAFKSPFPAHNALHMIAPTASTKYEDRSLETYSQIAAQCADICDAVPGNCAIFLPSYDLLTNINTFFSTLVSKTVFVEHPALSKDDRVAMLERFKSYQKSGAVLLGVSNGSFGEGIDLPGDLLKCVIIVGLPLPKPDLETNQLIKYYDAQFAKGWMFGYVYPAFNKTLQNAGRCIRSDTDRGVIVYLDKRYAWSQYKQCFPPDLDLKTSFSAATDIRAFFSK